MKRGGYGTPFRPPADGWPAAGRKVFFGALYQHQRPALNGLTAFQNTTQVPLQPNQVGPPVTRYTPDEEGGSDGDCEVHPTNGLIGGPWLGPDFPPALAVNTYTPNGTVDFGKAGRRRGFKNVQAVRQWHGALPWNSHDPVGCNSTACRTLVTDSWGNAPGDSGYVTTYDSTYYEPEQLTASQIKYLALGFSAEKTVTRSSYNYSYGPGTAQGVGDLYYEQVSYSTISGACSVDAGSGKITSTLKTTQQVTENFPIASPPVFYISTYIDGGAGYTSDGTTTVNYPKGMVADVDADIVDVHCLNDIPFLAAALDEWNEAIPLDDSPSWQQSLPEIGGWSVAATINSGPPGLPPIVVGAISLAVTRTDTVYSWALTMDRWIFGELGIDRHRYVYNGSFTLSNPNTSASVYGDLTGRCPR